MYYLPTMIWISWRMVFFQVREGPAVRADAAVAAGNALAAAAELQAPEGEFLVDLGVARNSAFCETWCFMKLRYGVFHTIQQLLFCAFDRPCHQETCAPCSSATAAGAAATCGLPAFA